MFRTRLASHRHLSRWAIPLGRMIATLPISFTLLVASSVTHAAGEATRDWRAVTAQAKGQTVYFNAWAGSEAINAYIQWVATTVKADHGITLKHVKISDAADVVNRIRAEKQAGRDGTAGTVDLMWINGENFAAMKRDDLLGEPFARELPNFKWVDTVNKPTTLVDFSVPTEGLESPWGMAQLTFFSDGKRLPNPPEDLDAFLALAQQSPGRLTYPRPPDFHGTTFLKQVMLATADDPAVFKQPATATTFESHTKALWTYLDELHPALWRAGQQFPNSAAAMTQMVADGELLIGLTFNPNEAANEIAAQRLPETVQSWQFKKGTIGNTHFVAIPFNAPSKAGARVVANFLLSPEAQARKAAIDVWGDPTVLAVARLSADQQALFKADVRPGQLARSAPVLTEPHASWVGMIEKEWIRRYAR